MQYRLPTNHTINFDKFKAHGSNKQPRVKTQNDRDKVKVCARCKSRGS